MKKILITSILIANTLFLFTACESNQPIDKLLKNDTKRSEIISSFINYQPYRIEMMNAMVQNDSCRNMMGQSMMGRPEMMGMMMKNPKNTKGSMNHMVNMAAKDTVMFNSMIQMMKANPELWHKVMKMNTYKTN